MNEIKLKPCPFCGGQAILLPAGAEVYTKTAKRSFLYAVTCKDVNCAATGGVMTSEIDAAEVWNRRADNG